MFQKVLVEAMADAITTEAGITASGAGTAARPATGPIRQAGGGDLLPVLS
jgi:hypothetical protein